MIDIDGFGRLSPRVRAVAEALARTNPSAAQRYIEGQLHDVPNAERSAPRARNNPSLRDGPSAHLEFSAKALKVTVVLDPVQLARCRISDRADHVSFTVTTADGQTVTGRLNPKTARKAIARISATGRDKVTAILQGQLQDKRLENAGLAVQLKAPKE